MNKLLPVILSPLLMFGLLACSDDGRNPSRNPGAGNNPEVVFACSDGRDNDADGLTDFPDDPGCLSESDNDENDPTLGGSPSACDDQIDNDGDGLIDFPNDPGCDSATDNDETNTSGPAACDDGIDNDTDGLIDFPDDPGCESILDEDESDSGPAAAACADGIDNDADGLIDFPDDPGCSSAEDIDETDVPVKTARNRYSFNNQCWAIKSNAANAYVTRSGDGIFSASAESVVDAEPFFFKPSALGKYLIYSSQRELLAATTSGVTTQASASATDAAEWTLRGVGDDTAYPETPAYHVEPTVEQVAQWSNFQDPMLEFDDFTLFSADQNLSLSATADTFGVAASGSDMLAESFRIEPIAGCVDYPEASSNVSGTPFAGKTVDDRILGHADVHVHISATEFLGGAEHGRPYHKFGVEHALDDCDGDTEHGQQGSLDFLSAAFTNDLDGHATDGYPEFTEWPARNSLTHEAIYWKWLERSWASGLRVVVNDLVDNTTLCELQRNAKQDPTQDCNSMNNAGRQAGTMYGMENYIDAQYGGPGQGFFQVVHTPEEARAVIEDGKMAVVLGIEISNLFNCQLTYAPNPQREEPFEETGAGLLAGENGYNCTMEEGQPNSVLTQIERVHGWGVRQIISIHEFDNAFGGNGIFDGQILNLGNRENSGGILSSDLDLLTNGAVQDYLTNLPEAETPTGEFWTTYDCPIEDGQGVTPTPGFSGWFWGNAGGSQQNFLQQPACIATGQGGRSGGSTPCYPTTRQCNARWMTPIGQYMFGKLMELGFIIDFDHLAVGMKTQLLELAEAQEIVYPLVSTHGTFGGITNDQAERVLKGGGFLYPSNGSSRGFIGNMNETLAIYQRVFDGVPVEARPLFGFGYGTDTNGLSAQSGPRGNIASGDEVTYPFSFFDGPGFSQLTDFTAIDPVVFGQPESRGVDGEVVRTWHEDMDGNAHHGMIADFIEEIRIEASPGHLRHLFNSAEAFLRTWQQTVASSEKIQATNLILPEGVLRAAPVGVPQEAPYK